MIHDRLFSSRGEWRPLLVAAILTATCGGSAGRGAGDKDATVPLGIQVVASNEVNGTGICDLALAQDFIYFNEPGGLWRVPVSGGTPLLVARPPANGGSVSHGLASDATFVWWSLTSGNLVRARRDGGVDLPAIGDANLPFGNGRQLYYHYQFVGEQAINGWGGRAQAVYLPPGSRLNAPPFTDPVGNPTRHAYFADQTHVYYALGGSTLAGGVDELWQAPLSGQPATRLSASRSILADDIYTVVADATHVYFGGAGDKPRRVPLGQSDGPVEFLDQPTDGASAPPSHLVGIIVDEASVIWAYNNVDGGTCASAVIRRQAKTIGSAPSMVIYQATDRCLKDLVSDGLSLYWAVGPLLSAPSVMDQILKVAK